MIECFGREAVTQSRRSVLCFTNKTSSYAYSGEATTSPLVAYNASHTLTKPHSSFVTLPALRKICMNHHFISCYHLDNPDFQFESFNCTIFVFRYVHFSIEILCYNITKYK